MMSLLVDIFFLVVALVLISVFVTTSEWYGIRRAIIITSICLAAVIGFVVFTMNERRRHYAAIAEMDREKRSKPSTPEPYQPYGKYGQRDYERELEIESDRRQKELILITKRRDPCDENRLTTLPEYPYVMRSYLKGRLFETLKFEDAYSAFGQARYHISTFHVGATSTVSCAKHSRVLAKFSYDIQQGIVKEQDYGHKKRKT